MRLVLTDATFGVREWALGELPRRAPCPFACPCAPCAGREVLAFCCAASRECLCLKREGYAEVCRMPAAPGVCAMRLSPCERYLYQLSGEADCVHTRLTATGELLYAAPCGVFPRAMRLHPSGRALLAAGGAVGEAYVLTAPELRRERVIYTREACFAADFWQGGLVLVCATEGEAIRTVIYTLSGQELRRVATLPGQPGGLCVCPDGRHALLSTRDGLMKLDVATGRVVWRVPEWALCMEICCEGGVALVGGTLTGQAALVWHQQPWQTRVLCAGEDARGCFCP